ncbi:ninjurin-1 isoform X2 [Ictidomys tridecemlineatus]
MDSSTEEYELNGDLRPGSPGSPDASVRPPPPLLCDLGRHLPLWARHPRLCGHLCASPAAAMGPEEPAHQHEPLRQQEERSREHAGHRAADGQRVPAEGRGGAGPQLCLLRAPGGPHLHLPGSADQRGRAAHLPRQVRP